MGRVHDDDAAKLGGDSQWVVVDCLRSLDDGRCTLSNSAPRTCPSSHVHTRRCSVGRSAAAADVRSEESARRPRDDSNALIR